MAKRKNRTDRDEIFEAAEIGKKLGIELLQKIDLTDEERIAAEEIGKQMVAVGFRIFGTLKKEGHTVRIRTVKASIAFALQAIEAYPELPGE